MNQYKHGQYPPAPVVENYDDCYNLSPNERWGLYWYWIEKYKKYLIELQKKLESNYQQIYKEFEEIKSIEDIKLMKQCHVVGMTTTGAARYQTILENLKCPIGR